MRAAGVDMHAYDERYFDLYFNKIKLPFTVTCSYFLAEAPVPVQVTVLARGQLKIEVADDIIGTQIETEILRYISENQSQVTANAEHQALTASIDEIWKTDGITPEDVKAGKATTSRRAQEALMELCEQTHFMHRGTLYSKFISSQIPKEDHAFVTGWLLKRFAVEKDPSLRSDIVTVFLNRRELILSKFADEVIRLIKDSRYGDSRSGMIYYLTKLRHSQAADLIASVMDEGHLAWSALRCLGDLKAKQHEARVRKYLRDPDSEIRLEAKRALKKMGCDVGKAPAPVHLVRNRKLLPKDFEEWSANIDFEQIEPVMKTLAGLIEDGFGATEIAEVLGVAEVTKAEQTRALRFPITASGRKSEVWIVIFMDDINSPDFEIHAAPELIQQFDCRAK